MQHLENLVMTNLDIFGDHLLNYDNKIIFSITVILISIDFI